MAEYEVRPGYYYTRGDTWIKRNADGTIFFGITDYAQKKLKEIEYLTLPEQGENVIQGDSLGEVESKKSVSEMMSPLTGFIEAVNEAVQDDPALLNRAPYETWIVGISCSDYEEQIKALMDDTAYTAYIMSRS